MSPIDRAIAICLKPRATFVAIEQEKAGFTAIYRDYVLWLAALPPLVGLCVGLARAVAAHDFGSGRLAAMMSAAALLDYVCLLAGVYLLALVIDLLAPLFGGERDEDQALRLCAYALTPSFVASALAALPGLAWVAVLGLYAIVLVIIGLPVMMRCATDRALGYGASAAIAMAAIALATSELTSRVLAPS